MTENSFSSPRDAEFLAGLHVLAVDDEPTCLIVLKKMLKVCSYEVTTCGFARDALNLICERKDTFDIVISNVHMPDMDGFELLKWIRLEMDLPVIMMSAYGAKSQVMKGIELGACDYLLKPIGIEVLRNIWQHAFRSKLNKARETEIFEEMVNVHVSRNESVQSNDGCSSYGENLTSINQRKDDKGPGDNSFIKKAKVVWTPDLHRKFVNAVDQIGIDKVSPKKILDLMNMPRLTREDVAARLQKYRLYLSRFQKAITYEAINYSHTSSGDSTASVGTQYSCKQQRDTSDSNYRISFNSLPLNYRLELGNYESDQEGSVSMPVAACRISSTTDVSDFWKSRDSQSEFNHSCQSSESEVNFATFDSTFLFVPSRNDEKKQEDDEQEHKDDEKEQHQDDKEEQTSE